ERRAIEKAVLDAAIAQIEAGPPPSGALIMAAAPGWHPGVIGIVASRLKERYGRPACVVAIDAAGLGKGSGRSVPGLDLGSAVIAARQAGLLSVGGGHPMAAGFTIAAFRSLQGALGPALLKAGGAAWHLAGHLRLETWQGSERVQLLIDDAAPAGQGSPAGGPA